MRAAASADSHGCQFASLGSPTANWPMMAAGSPAAHKKGDLTANQILTALLVRWGPLWDLRAAQKMAKIFFQGTIEKVKLLQGGITDLTNLMGKSFA